MFGTTLVLWDVVSQGFFGNDGLSCNCFCIGMLKMQGYYLCIQAEVTFNEQGWVVQSPIKLTQD